MANPRPTPTAIRLAKGNPGKKKLSLDEPQPSKQLPPCPDYLPDGAKAVWARLVPELTRLGVLTSLDVGAFQRYCINVAEWRACVDFIKANGSDLVVRDADSGEVTGVVPYPQVKRKREYEILLLRYEQEFGLTPSSRSKIHAIPADDEDELDELLGGGNSPLRLAQ